MLGCVIGTSTVSAPEAGAWHRDGPAPGGGLEGEIVATVPSGVSSTRELAAEAQGPFGGALSWQRLDDQQGSGIVYTLPVGGCKSGGAKWRAMAIQDAMPRLAAALMPHLEKLKMELAL
jgi:hypothetical protein